MFEHLNLVIKMIQELEAGYTFTKLQIAELESLRNRVVEQAAVINTLHDALTGMEKWASKVHDGYPDTTASQYAKPFRDAAKKALLNGGR